MKTGGREAGDRNTGGRNTGCRNTGGRNVGGRKTGSRKKAKYVVDTEGSQTDRRKLFNSQAEGSQKLGRLHAGRRQTNRGQVGRQVERPGPYEPMETDGQHLVGHCGSYLHNFDNFFRPIEPEALLTFFKK
jgi:hypothetical protein